MSVRELTGRQRLLAPYRVVLVGVLVVLALLGALALKGPTWWQRMYYPLRYAEEIDAASRRHRIDPYLLVAVVRAESDFDADTESKAGAVGLMQVMPSTATELRKRGLVADSVAAGDLKDPKVNLEYGAAYLRHLIGRYHEVEPALAAYNAGLRNADVWAKGGRDIRQQIEFPATKHYVVEVVRSRETYRRLYPDAFEGWAGRDE